MACPPAASLHFGQRFSEVNRKDSGIVPPYQIAPQFPRNPPPPEVSAFKSFMQISNRTLPSIRARASQPRYQQKRRHRFLDAAVSVFSLQPFTRHSS